MKTTLPAAIASIEEAKAFLTDLHNNNESFHPEDDAHDIAWTTVQPTPEECDQLNKLMDDIYNLPGNDGKHDNSIAFCPCGFLLDLDAANTQQKLIDKAQFEGWMNYVNAEELLYQIANGDYTVEQLRQDILSFNDHIMVDTNPNK